MYFLINDDNSGTFTLSAIKCNNLYNMSKEHNNIIKLENLLKKNITTKTIASNSIKSTYINTTSIFNNSIIKKLYQYSFFIFYTKLTYSLTVFKNKPIFNGKAKINGNAYLKYVFAGEAKQINNNTSDGNK